MKKIVAILILLIVGMTLFAGCSSTNVNDSVQKEQTSLNTDTKTESSSGNTQKSGSSSIPQPPALPSD